jgi:hydroxymethylglutaryl-CoA synthase
MNAGIDLISFYTTRYYLELKDLAEERGVDPDKFIIGLGQERMAVPPPDEDVVTMAASAAQPILDKIDKSEIELVLFATETGIDASKAAGLFVHGLLDLPSRCRVVELKEACYSGTAALRFAAAMVQDRPETKALVIASDVARYDLGSPGEPTQGCGAVAMLIAANPRILKLDDACGLHAKDVMDFWRPGYRDEAIVDGKYSTRVYMQTAAEAWKHYAEESSLTPSDLTHYCYHLPFTRMSLKAHAKVLDAAGEEDVSDARILADLGQGLEYSRQTGNCYTASLYEGLACLLDHTPADLADKRIGFFSYGSGCMGEFFSGVVQPGYRDLLFTDLHHKILEDRTALTCREYEDIFNLKVPQDGWKYIFSQYRTGPYRFGGIEGHKRIYENVA